MELAQKPDHFGATLGHNSIPHWSTPAATLVVFNGNGDSDVHDDNQHADLDDLAPGSSGSDGDAERQRVG
jgi:hypothetical protein